MLYPLKFQSILKERVWGGRNIERKYGKKAPEGFLIGESWDVSDRPGDASIIINGPLAGKTLRWVMENRAVELLGAREPMPERFPLLVKIIDAQEVLSLQVHPPQDAAARLGGEPKAELWYVVDAAPGAELFAGLKNGVTREYFQQKLRDQTVADCVHRIPVKKGDSIFLPSGRVHALGKGVMIFEVQQNSDTTYRVFDWNRVDATGQGRELHVEQALASINFEDFEPGLSPADCSVTQDGRLRPLTRNEFFSAVLVEPQAREPLIIPGRAMRILGVVEGTLRLTDGDFSVLLRPGEFCVLPACLGSVTARAEEPCAYLQVNGA